MIETVRELREDGRSWARVADELNARQIPPGRERQWYPDAARRVALRPHEQRWPVALDNTHRTQKTHVQFVRGVRIDIG